MGLAVKVYEVFKDDEKKAKVLSEVIDKIESRIAPLRDVTTKKDLEVLRLSLQKEIEKLRGEMEQIKLSFQREIEKLRGEMEQTKLSLQKDIETVKSSIIKWVIVLVIQTSVIVSVIALVR